MNRKFTDEFKKDAVRLANEIGCQGVRREGYHVWLRVELSGVRQTRQAKDNELLTSLKNIKAKNKKYGTLRLRRGLSPNPQSGKRPSYGKVYDICKKYGLLQKVRKPKGLTKADSKAQASEDLIKRDFTADAPNKKWLSDITEVETKDGKLYIAGVLDCCDGVLVGLSMDDNMHRQEGRTPQAAFAKRKC